MACPGAEEDDDEEDDDEDDDDDESGSEDEEEEEVSLPRTQRLPSHAERCHHCNLGI